MNVMELDTASVPEMRKRDGPSFKKKMVVGVSAMTLCAASGIAYNQSQMPAAAGAGSLMELDFASITSDASSYVAKM